MNHMTSVHGESDSSTEAEISKPTTAPAKFPSLIPASEASEGGTCTLPDAGIHAHKMFTLPELADMKREEKVAYVYWHEPNALENDPCHEDFMHDQHLQDTLCARDPQDKMCDEDLQNSYNQSILHPGNQYDENNAVSGTQCYLHNTSSFGVGNYTDSDSWKSDSVDRKASLFDTDLPAYACRRKKRKFGGVVDKDDDLGIFFLCQACGTKLLKNKFSKRQFRKGPKKRRCRACVASAS